MEKRLLALENSFAEENEADFKAIEERADAMEAAVQKERRNFKQTRKWIALNHVQYTERVIVGSTSTRISLSMVDSTAKWIYGQMFVDAINKDDRYNVHVARKEVDALSYSDNEEDIDFDKKPVDEEEVFIMTHFGTTL